MLSITSQRFCQVLVFAISLMLANQTVAQETHSQSTWPQFRGADFNPTGDDSALPEHWSATENVEWSKEIAGRGWSSPIVVDGKIFLTSVVTDGESKKPQSGTSYSNDYVAELKAQGLSDEEVERKVMDRDFEMPDQVSLQYYLVCLDLSTGAEIWKQEYHAGKPPGGRHRKNSFASETPVTDGKLIYVYATHLGLFAYDFSGNQVWRAELENHPIYLEFGTGTSPVLCDDMLIIVDDNEERSTITAYSTANGEVVWQTERSVPDEYATQLPKSGWSTPYIWKNDLRTEIITISPGVAISYDTQGQELWRLSDMTPAPSSSSFAYDGLLYLNGGKTKPIFAIRPGAEGDITPQPGEDSNEFVVWSVPRAGTYIPTPVAYRGALYIVQDSGIAIRIDAKTGEQTFKARISGGGAADFTSSPWAYNGKVFCVSEQGNTYVFDAAAEYNLSHTNPLEDFVMATPAIVGDRLLLRTEQRLYSFRATQ
mgnify:CR=1 FL=1